MIAHGIQLLLRRTTFKLSSWVFSHFEGATWEAHVPPTRRLMIHYSIRADVPFNLKIILVYDSFLHPVQTFGFAGKEYTSILPTSEMDKDGQLFEEKRKAGSVRCLQRYPGLSISLEPDPRSGDPEVKITELNTGTPITPILSKNYQRPSLGRIGRQLQVTEGLKCALKPVGSAESDDNTNISKTLDIRDDHVGDMHYADAGTCAIITKPFRESLQRSSLGFYNEDRPVKEHFQRPSVGINIGFHREDHDDLVMATSLSKMGGACGVQMVSVGLNTEEPIRLPREDSFAVLAKAREELANQPTQKVTASEKCVGIQTDVSMEHLLHQGNDKDVGTSLHELNISIPVEASNRSLLSEAWEESLNIIKYNKVVPDRETFEMDARMLACEPGDNLSKREVPSSEKHEIGSGDVNIENVLPTHNLNEDRLQDNLDDCDITRGREFGMQKSDAEASNSMDQLMHLSMPNNVKENGEVVSANNESRNDLKKSLASEVSGSCVKLECTKVPKTESSIEMPKTADLRECMTAISSCDLIDYLIATKLSNREVENDKPSLVQREAKITGPSPSLLDFLNIQAPQHAERNKSLSLLSSHCTNAEPYDTKLIRPCAACASSKGTSSSQWPKTNTLRNSQCCLDVLDRSQEAELLKTRIKNRCYLLALQICFFIFVLFWGGLADVLVAPPPT
ncbi:hypothetical protein L7F22_031977 [Adiantum nelumboides]|nr:hypothetical protein [Adiantum nelumboides]